MLHYHVWFNLKTGVSEQDGMAIVSAYLYTLSEVGEAADFQLLRNSGRPPRSKLPAYHALVQFADAGALDAAMKKQAERGIHVGGHGRVIDVVCDFHVEIFTSIPAPERADALMACEI